MMGGDLGLKKKVLIIDDDLDIHKEIKYFFKNEPADVYCTLSVKEALEQFVKHQFCLIIMETQLSETDGGIFWSRYEK